jgi:hypothetical protein
MYRGYVWPFGGRFQPGPIRLSLSRRSKGGGELHPSGAALTHQKLGPEVRATAVTCGNYMSN